MSKHPISVPVLGGYDAKIRISKVCRTALAFDQIDEFAELKAGPTEFLQSLFDSGNAFEANVIVKFSEQFDTAVVDCAAGRDKGEIEGEIEDARASTVVILGGNREGNSRELRANATHDILADPGDVTVVLNARLWAIDGRTGEPDLLVRSDDADGGFTWLPGDIKDHAPVGKEAQQSDWVPFSALTSASSTDFGATQIAGRVKVEDVVQLAHYRAMLASHGFATGSDNRGFVIGRAVNEQVGAVLADLDRDVFERNTASAQRLYAEGYDQAVDLITTARTAGTYPAPELNTKCGQCGYREVCKPMMVAADELTLLAGVTPRVAKALRADGINTISDLAAADAKGKDAAHVDSARVWRHAVDTGKRYAFLRRNLNTSDLALKRTTLFVDFESTMGSTDQALRATEALCYMWGTSLRISEITPTGKISTLHAPDQIRQFTTYDPTPQEEARVFAEFWKYLTDAKAKSEEMFGPRTFCMAVYSGAEARMLKSLARRHAGDKETPSLEEVEAFIGAYLIDQLGQMKRLIWPASDFSLKSIAQHLGFDWDTTNANGAASTEWYTQAVHGETKAERDAARNKLERYNEDDVKAQMVLADRVQYVTRIAADAQFKPVTDLEAFYGPNKKSEPRRTRNRLSPKAVREIRKLAGRTTQAKIGKKYGVARSTISNVVTGRTWAWV